MLIDCDSCAVRDLQCDDCVVSALLGPPADSLDPARQPAVHVGDEQRRALDVLAEGGLVPRLRLVPLGLPDTAKDARAGPAERSA